MTSSPPKLGIFKTGTKNGEPNIRTFKEGIYLPGKTKVFCVFSQQDHRSACTDVKLFRSNFLVRLFGFPTHLDRPAKRPSSSVPLAPSAPVVQGTLPLKALTRHQHHLHHPQNDAAGVNGQKPGEICVPDSIRIHMLRAG